MFKHPIPFQTGEIIQRDGFYFTDLLPVPMNLPPLPPLDQSCMDAARARQDTLTKPQGSLGRLEELSIQLAGIYAQPIPSITEKAIIVMAGDHGVVAEGVSAFPQEVTPQMVSNFLNGGAAINVLARQARARVVVVDMGVAAEMTPSPGLVIRKIAPATQNIAIGAAMTRAQAEQAVQTGIEIVEMEIERGADLIATGDMGIGNTTPSAAIAAAFTGQPPAQIAGRGTGLDDAGLKRKIAVIERALAVNQPNPHDGLDVLAKVGGFEIGGLAGVIIGAAARRKPVVVDGFISHRRRADCRLALPGSQTVSHRRPPLKRKRTQPYARLAGPQTPVGF